MSEHVLVIGAGGGIGKELVNQLCTHSPDAQVYSVSRGQASTVFHNQQHFTFDSTHEHSIKSFVDELIEKKIRFSRIICTTGVLHTSGDKTLKPEKRLEDIDPAQLAEYFRVNTAVPAMWLKYLVKIVAKDKASIVFFSARVGSISENGIGGWYGYRASKAALNMIVKTASIEYMRRAPNTTLACYHPGTVDTGLSKPFQSNVKPGKLFSAEFTVSQLLSHMHGFDAQHSPYYIDWDGKTIPY
ncbi:oxidoreductase, short-chain dehydrogenase/reductase family protein [Glaciecola punicea ACAM 611]|uniref:Oxidoreductase, short-chain dehydrogenase/reductase family protein n=1 Tax=Glaciecola punicea ACAM 611 TaxID=1121923 RepID=H5TD64_9ALTE|nr:SDR family NAD(P)-dependent oxidoreductase [Glaciecola punicea]GAB56241.1 oxidoreductase, short-chain dehydrogenase/reductase family protein [Glaciecola punicea ACAM 611]